MTVNLHKVYKGKEEASKKNRPFRRQNKPLWTGSP